MTPTLTQARANVPVAFHALPSGGHGFGLGKAGTPSAAWPQWYETWLHNFDHLGGQSHGG
jgi:hypothetical protein